MSRQKLVPSCSSRSARREGLGALPLRFVNDIGKKLEGGVGAGEVEVGPEKNDLDDHGVKNAVELPLEQLFDERPALFGHRASRNWVE